MGSRRIFLSYAREDAAAARDLHARLRTDGFRVWLDLEDVLPGQLWEPAIEKAIQDSGAFIILLTPNAVTKTGYVQKEMRTALEMAELMPDGRVFIIPVRLTNCDVPSRLKKWQWVDLFDEKGYERLRRSLRKHLAAAKTKRSAPRLPREPLSTESPLTTPTESARSENLTTRRRARVTPSVSQSPVAADVTPVISGRPEPAATPVSSPAEFQQPVSELRKRENVPTVAPSDTGATATDGFIQAAFNNTTWHIGCRKCREKSRWIRLRPDGMVEFRFGNDHDFRFEGDDTWRVEANQLVISWRSGFSVETFTFTAPMDTSAPGTSSNVRGPLRITRL